MSTIGKNFAFKLLSHLLLVTPAVCGNLRMEGTHTNSVTAVCASRRPALECVLE